MISDSLTTADIIQVSPLSTIFVHNGSTWHEEAIDSYGNINLISPSDLEKMLKQLDALIDKI